MLGAHPMWVMYFPCRTISGQLMATLNSCCDQTADLQLLRPSLPRIDRLCLDGRHCWRRRQRQRLLDRCRGAGPRAARRQGSCSLKPLLRIAAGAAGDLPQLQTDKEGVRYYKHMDGFM